jgi:orotidine-5'-phosphate decarboxylase
MENFADRLIRAIRMKGNPCVVGLDPRIELMPDCFTSPARDLSFRDGTRAVITAFCDAVLDAISPLVPAVKPQSAFYEQYGIGGLEALEYLIDAAKQRGLLVILDGKRNDISSTAAAYASAFLGRSTVFERATPVFDVDALTVSPYLGRDSLEPFVEACAHYGKGVFILVKTSNPGSGDLQDQHLVSTDRPVYELLGRLVDELGRGAMGATGYSSVGAVVGATFPDEARRLRKLMPRTILLVPGYGAQGGTAVDTLPCFNADALGAIVSASRSITFRYSDKALSQEQFVREVRQNTENMVAEICQAVAGLSANDA